MAARRALGESDAFETVPSSAIYRPVHRAAHGLPADDTSEASTSATSSRAARRRLQGDNASLLTSWRTSLASTTTIIRTKHATMPRRRKLSLIGGLVPVVAAAAVVSFGFLTPAASDSPADSAAPYAVTVAAGDDAPTPDAIAPSVDNAVVLSPADSSASSALQADADAKAAAEAAAQAAAEAAAKAAAEAAAARGSSGTSRGDYSGSDPSGTPVQVADGQFIPPVTDYRLGDPFGWRIHPVYGTSSFHNGADLQKPCGTPIVASADGVVSFAGWSGSLGQYVEINHGLLSTGYGHMSKIVVTVGQQVKQGQVIGYVGSTGTSTGCHVHFQAINADGKFFDPLTLLH